MKLYYFYTLKGLWDGQGKIKMYHGMSRVKKQLSGKIYILNPAFSFFQRADFQQNILPLHAPINMYNCNVEVYQNPPFIGTAPVRKNHEPPKKRHRVIYSSDSSQEI